MTQSIQVTNWKATASQADYVASQAIDAGIDLTWNLSISTQAPDSDIPIEPRYLTVDNTLNKNNVTVAFGPVQFTVSPYKRNVFNFPPATNLLVVATQGGKTTVYLSEKLLTADDQNNFLIAQAAVPPLSIPTISYNISKPQIVGDDAYFIIWTPTAADATYSLIDTGTGVVSNGFFSEMKNLGTKKVILKPYGPQLIDNFFTNASPLTLFPGQSGTLIGDATNWYWDGELRADSSTIGMATFVANGLSQFTHNLPSAPKRTQLMARCLTAEQGYSIGDEITVDSAYVHTAWGIYGYGYSGYQPHPINFYSDATKVSAVKSAGSPCLFCHKTTGAEFVPTNANWNLFVRSTL